MNRKIIAILEARAKDQMSALIKRKGGIPICAPAILESPDVDPKKISELFFLWETKAPNIFIFQTGVGVKFLFETVRSLKLMDMFHSTLESAQVIARGPKPVSALRSFKIHIDSIAKEPFTTAQVLEELNLDSLRGKYIVVQRYGENNYELQKKLESKGAEVTEISTYKWDLPDDIEPLINLIDDLEEKKIDMVAFTSSAQAKNLFLVAESKGKLGSLKNSLNETAIASIGPVCSIALKNLGIKIDVEADPPKLGNFISAINKFFSN